MIYLPIIQLRQLGGFEAARLSADGNKMCRKRQHDYLQSNYGNMRNKSSRKMVALLPPAYIMKTETSAVYLNAFVYL